MDIDNPFGAISYKGPGTFIAGGAGVTPFIAIFRDLSEKGEAEDNKLFFSNKTKNDIIMEDEFNKLLKPENIIYTLTREKVPGYSYGRIDENFLRKNISDYTKHFYICGPWNMVESINSALKRLGAKFDQLVFEE